MPIRNFILALAACICLNGSVFADVIQLAPNAPKRYVVVKGDTLWDISAKFLRDPWRWPDIWDVNPEIKNPHLIYPGDIISLIYRNGKPVLQLQRAGTTLTPSGRPTKKLSPTARTMPLAGAIPTIPANAISQFLQYPKVLTKKEIKRGGHVAAAEDKHLINGVGEKVYAAEINLNAGNEFSIYRIGDPYRDPEDNDILGYEALRVSDAQLVREGNPASLIITESYRETLLGDKIYPSEGEEAIQNFFPHAPDRDIKGQIIAFIDAISRAGQYQTVVINLGYEDGIEPGHVMSIRQHGEIIKDKHSSRFFKPKLKLPDEQAGLLMVVRPFERVSYALVMDAVKDIRLNDPVVNP